MPAAEDLIKLYSAIFSFNTGILMILVPNNHIIMSIWTFEEIAVTSDILASVYFIVPDVQKLSLHPNQNVVFFRMGPIHSDVFEFLLNNLRNLFLIHFLVNLPF